MDSFELTVNGERVQVQGVDPQTTLLSWLRSTGRTGTKEGCAEGDCGACTVALLSRDAAGRATFRAVNSCIALLPMFAGREIVTAEGLAQNGELHPVQQAMVERNGSQCGYCTPGFVMSMFEGYCRDDLGEPGSAGCNAKVGDQLNGNLCRCTGYRPIRDAMMDALAQKATRPEDVFQLRLKKDDPQLPALAYQTGEGSFLRPSTKEELLRLRAQNPDHVLVAGATEIGVYMNKRMQSFPRLISTEGVAELRAVGTKGGELHVGGAVTLTELEEALGNRIPAMTKMLWAFASRPIRSRATLAGNLITASPIGDMAPVLLALDARVVLASVRGERTVPLSEFFVDYRKTVAQADELLLSVIVPLPVQAAAGQKNLCDSFKVSKRRELDIAIVSSCFVVHVDASNVVTHARLAFGGVARTPVRATKAEAALVGKPWTQETVTSAGRVLGEELSPISDVRADAPYRRGLTPELLLKFYSGERTLSQDQPLLFERQAQRAASADASRDMSHESAALHVSGRALYTDDMAAKRDALFLWPVSSPHAHARVTSIDFTAAAAMPGVKAVLCATDIPGENDVGAVRKDETLLVPVGGETMFAGHMVAVVVATSIAQARRAAAAVKVSYEPLPAILSLTDAIAQGSFHTEPHVITRGDVDAALASSKHTLSGDLMIGGQEHFYLESHAAFAECGDAGDLFVVSSTQHPSEVQAVVSHVLHMPRNKVVVQSPRMGGGFGGKETQGNTWAALVALAAQKTRRPVRVQLDRDVDMMLTGKRHPFYGKFQVGFHDDGRITGMRVELTNDGGFALDLSESICDRGLFHLDNAYYIPAVRFVGRVAKTHMVSHTAFRGFGGPQGMLVTEEAIDRIARTLGLPPEVVRERNLYRGTGESNTTHYGQELGDNRIPRIWSELVEKSGLAARRASIREYNAKHTKVKRGIAITPVKFGISFTATFLNQAGALVLIYRDGTVQVNHGGTEMGQGLYTKLAGVTMRELGILQDNVVVMRTQTDKVPNTSATAASSGSDLNGQAVRNACEELRARILPVAAELLSARLGEKVQDASIVFSGGAVFTATKPDVRVLWSQLAEAAYIRQIQLSATGFYRTPGIGYDKKTGRGKPFYYFAYGAAVAEVEVDGYTGMKRVLAVDILHDVGDSLNPNIDRGQIEGAFVQGMGWLTGEELKWDAKGHLLSHSASTYQIPSIGDAPARIDVTLLEDAHTDGVIHGSKAVGEPPLMLAFSVREAIRDAISAFGPDASGTLVELGSPATHEEIFHAIRRLL
jgi:xanthine dehydrogenase molybdopterin binding subunit/xanthine dehydrogenase small subunit